MTRLTFYPRTTFKENLSVTLLSSTCFSFYSAGISTKMDPTSMMQSIEAIPKPEVFKKKDEIKKLAEGGSGSSGPPCPKWNSCEAKGKCSYEVENPGKTCNRPHICSYCFTKLGHTKTNHKESQCKRKEDDNSTSALERLPTS